MKKTILAALAASALATGMAQAAGFNGLYVGAGITSTTADAKFSVGGNSLSLGEGSRQLGFGINAGYGKTFGQFYLAGELAYAVNQGETDTLRAGNNTLSAEGRNLKSLSIIPGFAVNKDLLIYARLGKGTVDAEVTASAGNVSLTTSGDIDIITKGIGLEYAINKNLAVRAEFSVSDGDKTFESGEKDTVSANSLAAGIQYRF